MRFSIPLMTLAAAGTAQAQLGLPSCKSNGIPVPCPASSTPIGTTLSTVVSPPVATTTLPQDTYTSFVAPSTSTPPSTSVVTVKPSPKTVTATATPSETTSTYKTTVGNTVLSSNVTQTSTGVVYETTSFSNGGYSAGSHPTTALNTYVANSTVPLVQDCTKISNQSATATICSAPTPEVEGRAARHFEGIGNKAKLTTLLTTLATSGGYVFGMPGTRSESHGSNSHSKSQSSSSKSPFNVKALEVALPVETPKAKAKSKKRKSSSNTSTSTVQVKAEKFSNIPRNLKARNLRTKAVKAGARAFHK